MPISAGVFGMARTIRLCPFSQRDMSPMRMPADNAHDQLRRIQMRRHRLGDALQDLRLHRQHDGVVRGERGIRGGARLDAELLLIALARVFVGIDCVEVSGRDATLDETADQRGGHVATADKSNFHDVPKCQVP